MNYSLLTVLIVTVREITSHIKSRKFIYTWFMDDVRAVSPVILPDQYATHLVSLFTFTVWRISFSSPFRVSSMTVYVRKRKWMNRSGANKVNDKSQYEGVRYPMRWSISRGEGCPVDDVECHLSSGVIWYRRQSPIRTMDEVHTYSPNHQ